MRRRSAPRRSSSTRWLGWLAGAVIVAGGIFVLALPTLVVGYLQRFARSAEFSLVAEKSIESKLGGRASVATPVWQGDSASVSEVLIETPGGWQLDVREMRAALDFGAIRRGVWHVQSTSADEVTLKRIAPARDNRADNVATVTSVHIPAWADRYVPKATEVDGFDTERFQFVHGAWQIAGSRLRLGDYNSAAVGNGRFSIPGTLENGALVTPVTLPNRKAPLKLDLRRAAFRITEDKLALNESELRWKGNSAVKLHGGVRFKSADWQLTVEAAEVPVAEFLTAEWQSKLSGELEGTAELSGSRAGEVAWKAEVSLKKGVLTALPLLDKLATYTRVDRFKRLVLDIATASVSPEGAGTRLEKIVVQSNGLLRIEGTLHLLPADAIAGDFIVGVTPETLQWLPGAKNGVFVESNPQGPPGLHWARVRVAGTRAAPQEDLSSRLIGAAGMSLLLDTPGAVVDKAGEALLKPVLGEEAAKIPGQIINGTTKTIENGVKTGTDLINKVIPLFPGK